MGQQNGSIFVFRTEKEDEFKATRNLNNDDSFPARATIRKYQVFAALNIFICCSTRADASHYYPAQYKCEQRHYVENLCNCHFGNGLNRRDLGFKQMGDWGESALKAISPSVDNRPMGFRFNLRII